MKLVGINFIFAIGMDNFQPPAYVITLTPGADCQPNDPTSGVHFRSGIVQYRILSQSSS
jgi:hypothetical protein